MRKPTKEIQLTSYDDLFGINGKDSSEIGTVVEIPLEELYPFKDHPFQVRDDDEMERTVESIKNYGVLCPALVRPRAEGGYEIVAGHRRKRGCELAGLKTLSALIRNYTDDEATVVMVDSNIQRENILPSEKAFAYKMKMEALKHQGIKGKNDTDTAELVGEKAGESGRTVQRYIRLTELVPELLEMIDSSQLKITPAEAISYLSKEEQRWVCECIAERKVSVSVEMAKNLKKYSEEKSLTKLAVELTLCKEKKESRNLTFTNDKIKKYFPAGYSKTQMEDVIYMLLEKWSKNELQEG